MRGIKIASGILVVILLVVLGTGCSLKKDNTKQNSNSTNDLVSQNPQVVFRQTVTNLDKAKNSAKLWKNDAYFAACNLRVPGDMNPESLTETYVFGSPAEPNYWWTYSIDKQGKFVRAILPKEDYLGGTISTIDEKFFKKTYVEALSVAEANGGLDYRAKNPDSEVVMVLERTQPKDWLWWMVEYRSGSDVLKFRVSAYDGKIYDDQGNLKTASSK